MTALIWHLRFALLLMRRPYRWSAGDAWHYARISWANYADRRVLYRTPVPTPRDALAAEIGVRRR
ncbi:MAG: hypothetical protein U5M50_04120 [Sphingobium sp.]|nr:hypothetical protein [Sphingobium sp.]